MTEVDFANQIVHIATLLTIGTTIAILGTIVADVLYKKHKEEQAEKDADQLTGTPAA